jgi:hypothetical protein
MNPGDRLHLKKFKKRLKEYQKRQCQYSKTLKPFNSNQYNKKQK